MKFIRAALVAPVLVSIGCATQTEVRSGTPTQPLYEAYAALKDATRRGDVRSIVTDMLSAQYIKAARLDEANDLSTADTEWFATLLDEETGHVEGTRDDAGCLLLNGFSATADPVNLRLEFRLEGEAWRLLFTDLIYLESKAEFESAPLCPERLVEQRYERTEVELAPAS